MQGFGVTSSGWRFLRLGLVNRGDEGRVREGRVRGNLVYQNVVVTSTHCFLSRFFDGTLKSLSSCLNRSFLYLFLYIISGNCQFQKPPTSSLKNVLYSGGKSTVSGYF